MSTSPSKIEQIEALKVGKGIQHLLDEAYKIFGNPLLMHDLDYIAIAYTENHVTDDRLWNELVTEGAHFEQTKEFLRDESLIDIAASTDSVAILSSENMKYDRLFGKIYNKNHIVIGAVDIVACYKPLEDDDPDAFEIFCQLLSKEVGKIKYYQGYGEAYQESLICKLVDGEIEDKKVNSLHVEIVYHGMKWNLYLAVVDVAHIDPEYARLPYFKDLLKKTQPEYKYAIYSNYILIIVSTDEPVLDVTKDLSKLNRLFQKKNIYAGISCSFENLFDLPKHYQEALSALNNALEITSQRIFLYEQFKCLS